MCTYVKQCADIVVQAHEQCCWLIVVLFVVVVDVNRQLLFYMVARQAWRGTVHWHHRSNCRFVQCCHLNSGKE